MLSNQIEREQQARIIEFLQVKPEFNAASEIRYRINFLKKQLQLIRRSTLVLGISGGIDSTVTGRLAQLAVQELRQENYDAHFIAMRLPYGEQRDESDAQEALAFIQPDELITVNIKPASDALFHSLVENPVSFKSEKQKDFIMGNVKARQRMIAQYAVAGIAGGLVIGTDHAAEALMGFFTKFGDGGCDLTPLTGLNKRRVRALGAYLGAPLSLVDKCPTADLELLCPLLPDEEAMGITYHEIDDFLEGKIMDEIAYQIIFNTYNTTAHKRALPITPF